MCQNSMTQCTSEFRLRELEQISKIVLDLQELRVPLRNAYLAMKSR